MQSKNNRRLSIAASVAWMALIFRFSSEVKAQSSARSGEIVAKLHPYLMGVPEGLLEFLVRKSAHIGLYFVLGVLVCNVLRYYIHDAKKLLMWSMVWVSGYAALDEIHQLFVPGRSGEVRDVLIDSVAGLVGIGAYWLIKNKRGTSSSS